MTEPWWPVAALAVVQFGDAALCLRPVRFVATCLDDVRFPRDYWWVLSPLKFCAAFGLVIGIWIQWMATLTSGALVAYFLIAVTMHIRARDFGRNLFVNCIGMTLFCIAVLVLSVTD